MKIAVASCTKLHLTDPQPVWKKIEAAKPDALLLLGDNVYLDHDRHQDVKALRADLNARYTAQFAEPDFAALLKDLHRRSAPVIAIYDDHDFLGDNRYGGDHDPALREAARTEFIAAFAPAMTGGDVFHVRRLGGVDIVVLDERFYRRSPAASASDRDAILGSAQWSWLEQVVAKAAKDANSKYLLVASSTTVHRSRLWNECWEQYPAAFARLVAVLNQHAFPLVVSGDIHRNAVDDDRGLIEIVTSGAARKGSLSGSPRENYAILDFSPAQLHVQLHSLKVGGRFDFTIPRVLWQLP